MNIELDYNCLARINTGSKIIQRAFKTSCAQKALILMMTSFKTGGRKPDFILQAGSIKKVRQSIGLVFMAATTDCKASI